MITVTRLRGEPIVLNAELIETVEATPDTMITMTTGHIMLVRETPEQVVGLVIGYRKAISRGPIPGDAQ